jgi:APA family basic amino acid/polyamine antiporter
VTDPVSSVDRLARGVASTFGAGLFLGLAPASALAGRWSLAGVLLAAALAVLFVLSPSDSTAGPAAPALGILGRIAAAAAVAAAFGAYVVPERPEAGGVVLVVVVAAVVLLAPPLPVLVGRVAAVVVVAVPLVLAVSCFTIAPVARAVPPPPDAPGADNPAGLFAAAGLLYLCFAGARAGTPRRERVAVVLVVLAVCFAVAAGVLRQLGGERLALSPAPLRDVLAAADASSLEGLLAVGVTVACAFALRGALCDVRELAAGVRADRSPAVAVGLAAGVAALGVLLLNPVHALVGAALLLLGEAVIRLLAGLRRRA